MVRAGRVGRAVILCAVLAAFAISCGGAATASPPATALGESATSPENRIQQIAWDAVSIIRRLNINNLAYLQDSLARHKYHRALDFLIPEIQELAQQVVDVNAAHAAPAAAELLAAVDPLARAASEFRRYLDTDQDDALAAAYDQLALAEAQLDSFLTNAALADGPALRELFYQAGRLEIVAEPIAVSRVALGPFAGVEEAQRAQQAAAPMRAVLSQDGAPLVLLGPFLTAAEARAVAAQWRERNVEAAIREETVYDFRVTEVSPIQGRTWLEPAWARALEQPAHIIAVSPDGGAVLGSDTSGVIQRWTGEGERQWLRTLSLPTYDLAVAREGKAILAVGIGAQALDQDGSPRWSESLAEHAVILENAAISSDGWTMVASTSNAEGLGRAFGFNESKLAWFTSLDYHDMPGLNSFHLSPDGDRVALGGTGKGRFQVMVVNERGEKLMGSDLSEPVVDVALAGLNRKVVALTERHVSLFDVASQQLEWHRPARGRALAVSQPGDIIYVGGARGITAYYQDGCQLWVQDAMPVSQIVANRDYLIGLSENIRLVVLHFDGSILGAVSPLAPIRDFAVATEGNLLVTLDEEDNLFAWRLPSPEIVEALYPCR